MTFPSTVMVVAAHPDDEVLGCGATIARHADRGDEVHVLILAEGITSRSAQRERDQHAGELSELARAANKANAILGAASVTLHTFPDNRMDSLDRLDIIRTVEEAFSRHRPAIVYTHHAGDVNVDHRRTHESVVTASRPMPGQTVRRLLSFEVASSTEWQPAGSGPPFQPNWYVDVSATLSRKIAALEAYATEMREWPHARSVAALTHLAHWRGANIGVDAAEAFMLGRNIVLDADDDGIEQEERP